MTRNSLYTTLVLFFAGLTATAQSDTLMDIMKQEIDRQYEILSKKTPAVYFISYKVDEMNTIVCEGEFGSLTTVNKSSGRTVNVDLRVGDYKKDNTHTSSQGYYQGANNLALPLPINNSKPAIQQTLWMISDISYKAASESLNMAVADKDSTKNSEDFSQEKPYNYTTKLENWDEPSLNDWKQLVKSWSAAFAGNDAIVEGSVVMRYTYGKKYFISTEGTEIIQPVTNAEIQISASVRSDDGNQIPLHKSYFAATPKELPAENVVSADIQKMIQKLNELKAAPLSEPFAGPAIFSGGAAGVFFHEIFGHRIEADRLAQNHDSQTFKEKMGKKVLPKFISVVSDPTLDQYEGQYLSGSYLYDDQGVQGKKVNLVTDGILTDFLRSRKPLDAGQHSNGHARAQTGLDPVSRQSNLIVKSANMLSDDALRKMLIKECKKQKMKYGLYIKSVAGGYTMTDRYRPNAFSITPTEVYKIYVDGRPDELVRGVDLIGTPLTMFSEIQATGNQSEIFYGYCGAESGYIPVTATAPSLFVRKIETQKKMERSVDEPLLEEPNLNSAQ